MDDFFLSLWSQMCTISTTCESINALSSPALHLQQGRRKVWKSEGGGRQMKFIYFEKARTILPLVYSHLSKKRGVDWSEFFLCENCTEGVICLFITWKSVGREFKIWENNKQDSSFIK